MQYRQQFFIENRFLGEAVTTQRARTPGTEPASELWYCSACGDIYARCPMLRPDGSQMRWIAHCHLCRKCAPRQRYFSEMPGSVWKSWDAEYLDTLPPAVLQWELLRHIDSYERTGGYQNG